LIFRVPVDGWSICASNSLMEQRRRNDTSILPHWICRQIRDAGGAARFTGRAPAQNGPFGLAKRPLWRLSGLLRFSLPTGVSTFAFDCSASTRSCASSMPAAAAC